MPDAFRPADRPHTRSCAIAFVLCQSAAIFTARVLLSPAERHLLNRVLSRLQALIHRSRAG